ncbi:DNA topoisomerase 1 [Andreesenia angusta]|uniref:DNA topoisomerase 1 n=1 Tax=Andreesenia angusta TaxID=39480 RepID=A0A1S1V814_9FIRM|nr:type I DNA topoisomerase [Andreesenia angusta]OHW62748.1 DNA topoisomerase 1 [Andreesenia angusta]
MAKSLVIVESPAKAKTISKFLGRNYKVKASVGHVRDLPKSKLGIDIEENFEPNYITIRGKGPVIKELKSEAKKADKVYLATDPDREGEAISWHLSYILGLDEDKDIRIEFNEITKDAVKNAIKNPRKINRNLVDAQQARRVLDRLVGYKISPLLWKKVKKGLSAGRVQSIATKIICDREKEIDDFDPKEYWSIDAEFIKDRKKFSGSFYGVEESGKEKKLEIPNEEEASKIMEVLKREKYNVKSIKKGKRKRNPYAPYTTSSLQQDASKKINFSTKKTMIVAQQLYEGVDIKGEGSVGLVTYIRTDSTRVSSEAKEKVSEYILEKYGQEYLGQGTVSKKSKGGQDAHEAIRPTYVDKDPETIKESLSKEQYKLYKMIWDRFVASQMTPAEFETLNISIKAGDYIFRASGSRILFDGFLKLYKLDDTKDVILPELEEGEELKLQKLDPKQHFTQPPPRYSEATLVKTLEELGIGRPSTYAPTISTILARGYVALEKKAFMPTELGLIVTELLEQYFKDILDQEFTANLEGNLDKIELGEKDWKDIVSDFYGSFRKELEIAEEEMKNVEIKDEVTDIICEKCGRNMVIKMGRYGKFLACPGYPECQNAKPLISDIGIECPKCEDGKIAERRSKKGRVFYGCTNYPECDFVSWDKPIDRKCPECGEILLEKATKKKKKIICSNSECNYSEEHSLD